MSLELIAATNNSLYLVGLGQACYQTTVVDRCFFLDYNQGLLTAWHQITVLWICGINRESLPFERFKSSYCLLRDLKLFKLTLWVITPETPRILKLLWSHWRLTQAKQQWQQQAWSPWRNASRAAPVRIRGRCAICGKILINSPNNAAPYFFYHGSQAPILLNGYSSILGFSPISLRSVAEKGQDDCIKLIEAHNVIWNAHSHFWIYVFMWKCISGW